MEIMSEDKEIGVERRIRIGDEVGRVGIKQTLKDRGRTHGYFPDNAGIAQEMKEIIRAREREYNELSYPEREALDMIISKIARIVAGKKPSEDSWHDIVGYAKLIDDSFC